MATAGELQGKLTLDDSGYTSTLTNASNQSQSFEKSIIKAGLAVKAFELGFNLVTRSIQTGFNAVIKAGGAYEMLNTSLQVVARNAGISAEELDKMKQSLKDANTYGMSAAQVLQQFIMSGLVPVMNQMGISFTEYIRTTKDFSSAIGVNSKQAIEDFTIALASLRPELLQKYNLTRNLNEVYDEYAAKIGNAGQELSEEGKRAALLNYIMQEGSVVAGNYAATYQTAGKNVLSLNDASRSLAEELGLSLAPVLKYITGTLLTGVKSLLEFVIANRQAITQIALFITAAATAAMVILATAKAISLLTIVFGAVKTVYLYIRAFGLLEVAMLGVQTQAFRTILTLGLIGVAALALGYIFYKALSKQIDLAGGLDSVLRDTQKAGANTGAALGNMFKDTAKAGKDTVKQLQDEIYNYNKQLAQIVDNRMTSLVENRKALQKELEAFNKQQKEKEEGYNNEMDDLQNNNDQKLKDVESYYAQVLKVGSKSYDADYQEYLAAKTQQELINSQAVEALKQKFKEETEAEKAEFAERTSALQQKITEDEAFLQKHADVVKQINRDILLDDIEELQRNHAQRLAEIQTQTDQAAGIVAGGYDDMTNSYDQMISDIKANPLSIDTKKLVNDMVASFKEMGKHITVFVTQQLIYSARELTKALASAINYALEKIPGAARSAFGIDMINVDKLTQDFNTLAAGIPEAAGFANGGDFTVPSGFNNDSFGMKVSSGEHVRVTPAGATDNSRTVTMNNYFTEQQDPTGIINKLGFQLRYL